MKIYPQEIIGIKTFLEENPLGDEALGFSSEQKRQIQQEIQSWARFEKRHAGVHLFMNFLPLMILSFGFYMALCPWLDFLVESRIDELPAALALGIVLGYLEYSFVIYVLHEGGGHNVFFRGFKGFGLLKKILNQSARLFFADPLFYGENHPSHHRYLGTPRDLTNTQFVLPWRFLKAITPGAGILFPNDYQVYQNPERSCSRTLSEIVGGITLLSLNWIVSRKLGWGWSLFATFMIAPWFAFVIDRTRECTEHNLLPANNFLGSRELGLTPLALFIGGGPWGQPCHVAHHVAPGLNWYQQIHLHFRLKRILNEKQRVFLGFDTLVPTPILFISLYFKNWQILRRLSPQHIKDNS